MRKGNVLPIAVMALAIAGFVFMVFWAVTPGLKYPWSTKATNTSKNTNVPAACTLDVRLCPDGSTVVRVAPNCEFAPCPETNSNTSLHSNIASDQRQGWIKYVNSKYGFSIEVPPDWVRRSEFSGSGYPITNDDSNYLTLSQGGNSPDLLFVISIADRKQGDIIHPNTVAYWLLDKNIEDQTTATFDNLSAAKLDLINDPQEYFLAEHGQYFYQLTFNSQGHFLTQDILNSFQWLQPNETLVDVGPNFPFKSMIDISSHFDQFESGRETHVSVMGSKALVSNGGKLFLYDGQNVSDISQFLRSLAASNSGSLLVRGLGNNGKHWLVAIAGHDTTDSYLYQFDGKTWTDLTSAYHLVQPRIGGPVTIAWSGSYWLLGTYGMKLVKYQNNVFSDVSAGLGSEAFYPEFSDIECNSQICFIILNTATSGSPAYEYNGSSMSRVLAFDKYPIIRTAGWNGSYWLLGQNGSLPLLKYDGHTVTSTDLQSDGNPSIIWVKDLWLVGRSLTDGKRRDIIPMLDSQPNGLQISFGSSYALLLHGGSIFRANL